jgi:hypothetical protein
LKDLCRAELVYKRFYKHSALTGLPLVDEATELDVFPVVKLDVVPRAKLDVAPAVGLEVTLLTWLEPAGLVEAAPVEDELSGSPPPNILKYWK